MSAAVTRDGVDIMALQFLTRAPGDCVGVIETEEQIAAALIYIDLERRGLVVSHKEADGPHYFITAAGMRHLKANSHD